MISSDSGERVEFRKLSRTDIPSLSRWLADPDVARWWREEDIAVSALLEKYSPRIDGNERVRAFVIVIDGGDVGFIQAYRLVDHPAYARQLPVSADAVAIDLYIGESTWRGRGWGARVLKEFLRLVVYGEFGAQLAVIAPGPTNIRAVKTYERVGFRWLATATIVDESSPLDGGLEYVMVLSRESYFGGR